MSNIITRAGAVHIRVGGNTQEDATLVPSLADGCVAFILSLPLFLTQVFFSKMIEKNEGNSTSPVLFLCLK